MYILFQIFFHYGLSQNIVYSSLCYTLGPCCLSILYIIVCICPSQTPNPSLPHAPSPLATTSPFSMSVSLFLFCRWVHLCHILDSTYKWYHTVFVFLFLTSLSMKISRSIHVAANVPQPTLFLKKMFIYFWLHWVLVAACGIFCCSAPASLQLWCTGSVVVAQT